MSKKLFRYVVIVYVAASVLAVGNVVRAADEKTSATTATKSELSGKIEATDVKAGTITIKHKKETKTFVVAPNCKFTGATDKKMTLADLVVGDHVKVTYTQDGDKLVAHHVGHVDMKPTTEGAPPAAK